MIRIVPSRLLLTLVLAAFLPIRAASVERPAPVGMPGWSLDMPVTVIAQGQAFHLPVGYLHRWPYGEKPGTTLRRDHLAFSFWMPSRRYPEVESMSHPSFRPREPGRTSPPPHEYVATVMQVSLKTSRDPHYVSPRMKFDNYTSALGKDTFSFRQRFGLLEFWRESRPNAFTYYRDIDGTELNVFMKCTRPDQTASNPLCTAEVYFSDGDMAFFIVFSRNDIEHWRATILTARDFILNWMVETP